MGETLLELNGVSRHYGSLKAVDDVSFTVERGARHALIGPNGAGKSTLFSVIGGATPASAGTIGFAGRDITGLDEPARARAGLVRTFQHSSLFLGISVLDNVVLAVEGVEGSPKRFFPVPGRDRRIRELAAEQLAAVGLSGREELICGTLSHGERRQLEVAMVLACEPTMVLFDEPAAGMSAAETKRFMELIEGLPESVTVLIVEHDLEVVFRLARTVSVLAAGRLIAHGSPAEIRDNDEVKVAYLGESEGAEPLFY
ncbi:ABC transporter ATP-binding protein [Enemella evansiae]|uniref:ABC transporter ATP-binding protein n=1 Tax=Enemella evansiae TaxID=2016499 RepID=A0A255GCS4_9ACTN|nr:ABC transporter ATP-binding protein [Enemella evansiae]PFG68472.1 branched-chain amino acid transport system ATP-binding protein [Propionibacteriaceae bacterium ES.041]OYN95493.1 ABC transporter ATP-binding protein [Enemella evansiae]OYO01654.1 ABC transporter ATP-binding protein [Enemella evansiae]OYO03601.1 ABC transporter ATP-binding protein [Enemella evansiae]OYO13371.1 ABC transporter ATP-binding protein [Enemella evansiae]